MADREVVFLTLDVNIVTIPDGNHGTLSKGQEVTIHQALGSNYTVVTDYGHMVRIAGIDADALGKETQHLHTLVSETDSKAVEKNCWEVMKTVYDPEIPVNIVDLGLVYHCSAKPNADGGNDVHIQMTLTAPGCGMGPVLAQDVQNKLISLEPIDEANVELVWDPPWNQGMMTEAAKLQLGLM